MVAFLVFGPLPLVQLPHMDCNQLNLPARNPVTEDFHFTSRSCVPLVALASPCIIHLLRWILNELSQPFLWN